MAKVRNLSDTQQQIAFTEHDFYQRYVETFKISELLTMALTPTGRTVPWALIRLRTCRYAVISVTCRVPLSWGA